MQLPPIAPTAWTPPGTMPPAAPPEPAAPVGHYLPAGAAQPATSAAPLGWVTLWVPLGHAAVDGSGAAEAARLARQISELGASGRRHEADCLLARGLQRWPRATPLWNARLARVRNQRDLLMAAFDAMQCLQVQCDAQTFGLLLPSLSHLGEDDAAWSVFGALQRAGKRVTPADYRALVACLLGKGRHPEAEQVFDYMLATGTVPLPPTFALLMEACAAQGRGEPLWQCWMWTQHHGVPVDVAQANQVLRHLPPGPAQVQRAWSLLDALPAAGLLPNATTFTLLSQLLQRAEAQALQDILLQQLAITPVAVDAQPYNAYLLTQKQNGCGWRAARALQQMLHRQVQADLQTYELVLAAHAQAHEFGPMFNTMVHMQRASLWPNVITFNLMLRQVLRQNEVEDASLLIRLMRFHEVQADLATYRLMMDHLRQRQDPEGAWALYRASQVLPQRLAPGLVGELLTCFFGDCELPWMRALRQLLGDPHPQLDAVHTLLRAVQRALQDPAASPTEGDTLPVAVWPQLADVYRLRGEASRAQALAATCMQRSAQPQTYRSAWLVHLHSLLDSGQRQAFDAAIGQPLAAAGDVNFGLRLLCIRIQAAPQRHHTSQLGNKLRRALASGSHPDLAHELRTSLAAMQERPPASPPLPEDPNRQPLEVAQRRCRPGKLVANDC